MTARLEVLHAGPHVTVQDAGRPGLMRFGVPASGPMDRKALAIANTALGNPADTPGVEVSPGGLSLICHDGPLTFAIAGGGFILRRNDETHGSWCCLTLRPGDRLVVRPGPWGNWCYIAFAGALQAERWLGSAATHALSGLGGGALTPGRMLTIHDPRPEAEGPIPCPVWARPRARLHVTLGPQDHHFAPGTVQTFLSAAYRMTASFDRMGMRLSGPLLPPDGALGIPSQGVTRGAIQVAGDGVPTVLLADHQTTGGYPKIATLLSDDTDALAQLRPGQHLAFTALTAAAANAMARTRASAVQSYLSALTLRRVSRGTE